LVSRLAAPLGALSRIRAPPMASRDGLDSVCVLFQRKSMLPNFAIVGAQKSGTKTLHHTLARHPEVFMPVEPEEIHFFDLEENYARGMEWYEALFAGRRDEPRVGQTSPLYMYEPSAIERLARAIPEIRIIAILRNPVDRAYSHYWHEVRYGWESGTFEAALLSEPDRMKRLGAIARRRYSYFGRGCYVSQVERLFETFGRDRVLVLFNETLSEDPASVHAKVADFLAIDPARFSAPSAGPRLNSAMRPRSRRLQRIRPRLEEIYPLACGLLDRINLVAERYPPMDRRTRADLERRYADERERLSSLVDADLDRLWPSGAMGS
jgi:hypothetical protein